MLLQAFFPELFFLPVSLLFLLGVEHECIGVVFLTGVAHGSPTCEVGTGVIIRAASLHGFCPLL